MNQRAVRRIVCEGFYAIRQQRRTAEDYNTVVIDRRASMPGTLDPQAVWQSIVALRESQRKTDEQLRNKAERIARTDAKPEHIGQ